MKKTKKTQIASVVGLIAILVIMGFGFISCNDPTKCNKKCLKIGDTGPGGGIIFYHAHAGYPISDFKFYYLEATPEDQGYLPWSSNSFIPGLQDFQLAIRGGLGRGKENSALILSSFPNAQAAKACADYRGGGKDDWYLPNTDELKMMFDNKDILGMNPEKLTQENSRVAGGISDVTAYWSSIKKDLQPSRVVWSGGSVSTWPYEAPLYVRAIRAF